MCGASTDDEAFAAASIEKPHEREKQAIVPACEVDTQARAKKLVESGAHLAQSPYWLQYTKKLPGLTSTYAPGRCLFPHGIG
jgi:hypothetical protein